MIRAQLTRLILAAALSASAAAYAQPDAAGDTETVAARLRDRALAGNIAYDLTGEITARFPRRLAGTEGERRAASWSADRLRALGFENVRIETFPITVWERGSEAAEIVAPVRHAMAAAALGGSPATPAAGVEAEVVIFDTLDSLIRAEPGALRGRIALLNYRMTRTQTGYGYGPATAGRGQGPIEAASRGAVAFLLRSAGTDNHRLPHAGSTRYRDGAVPIPAFAISAPDADQIVRLAALEGPVRVRLRSTASHRPGTSQNVVGEISGGERPEQIVVIGGHLDAWDLGTGAVDDAVGVAITTAAARLIRELPRRPRRTVRLVLFGAEEASQPSAPALIAGGFAYATRYAESISSHVAASESDLGAGRIYGLALPAGFATGTFATMASRLLLPLGIVVDPAPALHGGADMLPLQTQSVPVFLLQQDATHYFDLHHSPDDTFDKIDRADVDQNVAAWAALLWLIADSDIDFRAPPAPAQ